MYAHIGNVNLYIRQAEFDTQIPEFDTQIPEFDTQISEFDIQIPEFDTWIRQESKLAPLSNIYIYVPIKCRIWKMEKPRYVISGMDIYFFVQNT